MEIKKIFRPIAFLIYEMSIIVTIYTELLTFPAKLWYGFVAGLVFMIFLYKLPQKCRLNSWILLLISIIVLAHSAFFFNAFSISGTMTLFDEWALFTRSYVYPIKPMLTLLEFVVSGFILFIACFFSLWLMRMDNGDEKEINIDLTAGKLKQPIENISDIENILLKLSPYSVTISKTNSTVQVKIFDTISEKWFDVSGKLKNNTLEITQKSRILWLICRRLFANRSIADSVLETASLVNSSEISDKD